MAIKVMERAKFGDLPESMKKFVLELANLINERAQDVSDSDVVNVLSNGLAQFACTAGISLADVVDHVTECARTHDGHDEVATPCGDEVAPS